MPKRAPDDFSTFLRLSELPQMEPAVYPPELISPTELLLRKVTALEENVRAIRIETRSILARLESLTLYADLVDVLGAHHPLTREQRGRLR